MNLIERITEEILSDDGDTDRMSKKMIQLYKEGTKEEKHIINNIFICLCGWTMEKLLKNDKGE